jgi:Predicted xylanase/chitin deacetylase
MVWEMDDDSGVYLTFDDGPTPGITEWILEELDKADAKATFFCLGKNIEMYPGLFEAILAAGHKVGNHTYSHLRGWEVRLGEYVEDVDFANQTVRSDLFRPPYGRISRRQADVLRQRYKLIMGGIVSEDYSPNVSPSKCLENITRYVRAGSIVVFHDSLKSEHNTRYALPRSLKHIKEMGLEFKTLEFTDIITVK